MHAMRDKNRERTQIIAGKGATTDKQTKYPSLFADEGVAHRRINGGRPVHPNQTKEVKG